MIYSSQILLFAAGCEMQVYGLKLELFQGKPEKQLIVKSDQKARGDYLRFYNLWEFTARKTETLSQTRPLLHILGKQVLI